MAATPLESAASGPGRLAIIGLLADGDWHTGVALGERLGLTRAGIWKQIGALRELGLRVQSDRRLGYRLDTPLELLAAAEIRAGLTPATREALEVLEILLVTASTNERLAGRAAPSPGRLNACLAEYQTGGRGRRGRRWLSPLGHGICLSVAWSYEVTPPDLPALGLVAGVAVATALSSLGLDGIQLKWPNDIMAAGGKLGGILVEVTGESGGPLRVVIGVGLNVRPAPGLATAVAAEGGAVPATALDDLQADHTLSRNRLVSALLNALAGSLPDFASRGFAAFVDPWRQRDWLLGQRVAVTRGVETVSGIARGIAGDGALLLEVDGKLLHIVAGDVSLREPA